MNKFLLAGLVPLVILLAVPHSQSAFAWDFGSLFNGFQGQGQDQGLHHWGFNNYGQSGCGAYCQGEQDAQYDHTQGLVYNPYPQCCHSQIYNDDFRKGYDQQWNTYQSQEQQTDQRSNIYINNSPGAYVNTAQSSNQGQGPSWTSSSPQCQQCLNTDNVNGDCSNGCPWEQGP
jgi:hypothetical protein